MSPRSIEISGIIACVESHRHYGRAGIAVELSGEYGAEILYYGCRASACGYKGEQRVGHRFVARSLESCGHQRCRGHVGAVLPYKFGYGSVYGILVAGGEQLGIFLCPLC